MFVIVRRFIWKVSYNLFISRIARKTIVGNILIRYYTLLLGLKDNPSTWFSIFHIIPSDVIEPLNDFHDWSGSIKYLTMSRLN